MYYPEEIDITEDHFRLLAAEGERIALITIRATPDKHVGGVTTIHKYGDTYVSEDVYPTPRDDEPPRAYQSLLKQYGNSDADVVATLLDEVITQQEQSDSEQGFTWVLEAGTEEVREDETVQEQLDRAVTPDRLDPDFDAPDDKPVAEVDIGYEARQIITEANDYHVGAPIEIHEHRGTTYIIGLTEEYASSIANAINRLQREYSDNGSYESAEIADRVEGVVLRAASDAATAQS